MSGSWSWNSSKAIATTNLPPAGSAEGRRRALRRRLVAVGRVRSSDGRAGRVDPLADPVDRGIAVPERAVAVDDARRARGHEDPVAVARIRLVPCQPNVWARRGDPV